MSIYEAAALIGVHRRTFSLWEDGRSKPRKMYYPAISTFLGMELGENKKGAYLSGKIREGREKKIFTRNQLASLVGVCRETIWAWETSKQLPSKKHQRKLKELGIIDIQHREEELAE